MTTITSFLVAVLIFIGCAENQEPQLVEAKYVRAVSIKRAGNVDLQIKPDSGLKLEMLSYEPKNGFWPWSDAKLEVTYRLTNTSDTTIYIPPPFYEPAAGGNPSFDLRRGPLLVRAARLEVRNIMPLSFIELEPEAYIRNKTWVFYAEDFEEGSTYNLTAYYGNSRWSAFTDKANKTVPIWTGRVSSDTIEFTY